MEPIKPTFSEVIYAEMATWLGRTPCKSCNTTVTFDVRCGMAIANVKSMGRELSVCCDLDWPEHRHESLGFDGKSTHPGRFDTATKEYLQAKDEEYFEQARGVSAGELASVGVSSIVGMEIPGGELKDDSLQGELLREMAGSDVQSDIGDIDGGYEDPYLTGK